MPLPTLTLYTRSGCSLCGQAAGHLRALDFVFTEVDVDADPALRARYGDDVPVLVRQTADGAQVLGKGAFSRTRLGTLKLVLLREGD